MLTFLSLSRELMYHYITTLYSLGARENVVHLWRNYIPQQAFENRFLMHGLLALAALHLAHLRPDNSSRYLRSCDKHQDIALQEFRSILAAPVDPELANALVALAATLSVSSMARSCAPLENKTMELGDITELFILTKGIRNMIHLAYEHVWQGPLAAMLESQQPYPEDTQVYLPLHVSSRFEAIRRILFTCGLDQEALDDCLFALSELKKIYKNIVHISATASVEMGDVSRWQVIVSMGYVKLIEARKPPALVILAYYAAAVTAVRTAWYAQGWAEYALRAISQALDDKMQHWVEWPMQQVQEKMSALGVRSPSVQLFDERTYSRGPSTSL